MNRMTTLIKKYESKSIFWTSLFFSLFTLEGIICTVKQDWQQVFHKIYIVLLIGFGLWGVYYVLLCMLGRIVRKSGVVLDKISIRAMLVFMGFKWFVFLLLCYPGSVPYDGFYMLGEYFGVFGKSNNHPFLATVLQGSIMALGRLICDGNMGIFLFLVIHILLFLLCVMITIIYMRKWKLSERKIKQIVTLFCICPVITLFAQYYRKDVVFGVFTYLYSLLFIDSLVRQDYYKENVKIEDIMMVVCAILSCLYRYNGIFIIVISLILRLIFLKHKKTAIQLIIVLISFISINTFVYPALGVEKVSYDRTYSYANSLRYMQTACYVLQHKDEISDYEMEALESVVDVKYLVDNYNTQSMDIFAMAYKPGGFKNSGRYNEIWIRHLKKDPAVYIKATLNFVYLYVYPYQLQENSVFNISTGEEAFAYFQVQRTEKGLERVNFIKGVYKLITDFPVTRILFSPAIYFWIIIYSIIYIWQNKRTLFVATSPIMISMLICMLGFMPVNGALHYAFPTIFMFPLICAVCLVDGKMYSAISPQK